MDVESLYQMHATPLHRYLVRLTGDADAAADLVQEAFVRLVERAPDEGHARWWLYRVATNMAHDRRRVEGNRARLLAERADAAPRPDAPETPDAELARRESQALARRALAALPERDRTALLMSAEGFTQREIAEALGTTTGSVGTLLARALRKMATAVAPAHRPDDLP